jgi:NTP pyrophosphatase (non-canonical NTP hydrolase)
MDDSVRWFGEELVRDLGYNSLALCGEAGELANLVKKMMRGDLEPSEQLTVDLGMEVVDVFIYCCNVMNVLGIDFGKAYAAKREFNEQRFGQRTGEPGPGNDGDSAGLREPVQQPPREG